MSGPLGSAPAPGALDRLKWETAGVGGIGACAAEMDFGTAPTVTAALRTAVDRDRLGYLTPSLAADAAAACADWQYERYGWRVAPEDVHLLPDVIRALHVAIAHFSRPGSPVIVPMPAYNPFLTVPRLLGREIVRVDLVRSGHGYVHDLDSLDRAFAAGGHLLVLCNPHNPLGTVMTRDHLLAVDAVVRRHGGRVFADEVHAPLVYPGHRHIPYASVSPEAARHTLTATSASKGWNLAGLKCAQLLLTNDPDRERWPRLGRLATDGTATLGAVAAAAAYRSGRPWLETVLARLDANRHLLAALLATHLPEVDHLPPEGTFLAWLDLRGLPRLRGQEDGLAELLARRAGITVVDGADCGPPGRGCARLNFATTPDVLTRLVERLAQAIG
ncbi:MalY/PatB family protein [Streptomyces catenulae]|uniref:cysteine-S-conjugate beta-lyase n=1 Tax=Streptomyces catenulae TaxID=66875 RepID=A0ABV2YZ63_9ACTN|nr:aminotransferase class I/II-fold pyridoxal phosphate-dependent enzyme [Streptomyces catenulae]